MVKRSAHGAEPTPFNRSLAVVIGINGYTNGIRPLETAVNDAQALARTLRDDHGYKVLLLDREVSAAKLRKLLEQTLPAVLRRNDDRLLFYFAGHGVADTGDDGPVGYLLPQDARPDNPSTLLPMLRLHDALTALPCRHVLAILDCCFAGAFRWSSFREIALQTKTLYLERFERYIRDPAWQLITSAAYDQKALDKFGERGQRGEHSPFAHALLQGLKGEADTNRDGIISATELYLYLREQVDVGPRRQTPGLWPLKKHDKGEFIFLLKPEAELGLEPAPLLSKANNPYRGLEPFEEEHQAFFFGRQRLTKMLHKAVLKQPFTVVLGASGTGKSSLVKAGLVPCLRRGTKDQWHIAQRDRETNEATQGSSLRPGAQPIATLAGYLRQLEPTIANPEPSLHKDPAALAKWFGAWRSKTESRNFLLIIDQFEELITVCRNEREREHFQALLANALKDHPDSLRIIITLRSDFEPQFSASVLEPHWSRFVVPPMTREALREAIEEPAALRVLYFDPSNLVDQLINESVDMPGGLSLLSFALSEMYLSYLDRQADNRAITERDYQAIGGGVPGALRYRANEAYEDLGDPKLQATMRRVMLRMVSLGGGELARRRVPVRELIYNDEDENRRVQAVLERQTLVRLLVKGRDVRAESYVEPAHDELVRAWDKLWRWLHQDNEQDHLLLQRRVTQATQEWEQHERKTDYLWNDDPRLSQLLGVHDFRPGILWRNEKRVARWLKVNREGAASALALNHSETHFVSRSVARRFWNRLRVIASYTAVLVLLASAALIANSQRQQAQRQARIAQARELAVYASERLEQNPELSLLLAKEAVTVTYDVDGTVMPEAETTLYRAIQTSPLRRTLRGHSASVLTADISPDGRRIVTASEDGSARLWDGTGKFLKVLEGHQGFVYSARFSPDGSRLITTGANGRVGLWEAGGDRLGWLEGHTSMVWSARFSRDGRFIITASEDGSARLWDSSGTHIQTLEGHTGQVRAADFSPDGRLIVTASASGSAQLWDLSGRRVATLEGHGGLITSAAFSPDSQRVLTASVDKTARLWTTEGQLITIFEGHQEAVMVAKFSPDGELIVTAGADGYAGLWNLGGQLIAILEGHGGPVWSAGFHPGGLHLITVSSDGTARLWTKEGELLDVLEGHRGPVLSVTFAPSGSFLLTTGTDDTARLWTFFVISHQASVSSASFSPDGKQMLTVDGSVRLWDREGNVLSTFGGHGDKVWSASFSPDGSRIATASVDQTARLWDTEGALLAVLAGHEDRVNTAVFSPDGMRVLTASEDGTARIWNETGEPITTLNIHQASPRTAIARHLTIDDRKIAVMSASFSPDGQRVIAAGYEGVAQVWDTEGTLLYTLEGHQGPLFSAMFSPDGNQIVTASADGSARLWGARGTFMVALEGHTGAVTSARFSPDGSRIVTASDDGSARLWTLEGVLLDVFEGHTGGLWSADFSPDGSQVITASTDSSARLWELWSDIDAMLSEVELRVGRDLTDSECQQYLHREQCQKGGDDGNETP